MGIIIERQHSKLTPELPSHAFHDPQRIQVS